VRAAAADSLSPNVTANSYGHINVYTYRIKSLSCLHCMLVSYVFLNCRERYSDNPLSLYIIL